MKSIILVAFFCTAIFLTWSCNSGGSDSKSTTSEDTTSVKKPAGIDSTQGIGKFKDVKLTHPLDTAMVSAGKKVFDLKCFACHRLTSEKLVGPGWKGVTDRRKPEWIMNFATNTDEMINKDPKAQALLEQCFVRMPNQNLSDADARNILEFMRNNDGKK